jgi:hypothetical protein
MRSLSSNTLMASRPVQYLCGLLLGAVIAATAVPSCDVVPPRPQALETHFIQWPPRGELAADQPFIASAVTAWDDGFQPHGKLPNDDVHFPPGTGPHRGSVRVLYAGNLQTGSIAVLEGHDAHNGSRLVIVGAPQDVGSDLELTNDLAVPDPAQTHALIIPRFTLTMGPDRSHYYDYESVLVLGEPSTKSARYSVTLPSGSSIEPAEQSLRLKSGAAVLNLSAPQPATPLPSGALLPWTRINVVVFSAQEHHIYPIDLDNQQGELGWSTCLVCQ